MLSFFVAIVKFASTLEISGHMEAKKDEDFEWLCPIASSGQLPFKIGMVKRLVSVRKPIRSSVTGVLRGA